MYEEGGGVHNIEGSRYHPGVVGGQLAYQDSRTSVGPVTENPVGLIVSLQGIVGLEKKKVAELINQFKKFVSYSQRVCHPLQFP